MVVKTIEELKKWCEEQIRDAEALLDKVSEDIAEVTDKPLLDTLIRMRDKERERLRTIKEIYVLIGGVIDERAGHKKPDWAGKP